MVTMLDCIRRVPRLLEAIRLSREETMRQVLEIYPASDIGEICLIGSGTSFTSASTAQYMMEKYAGMRVSVMLPNEFLHVRTYRNPHALHVFISQTGTSSALLEALEVCRADGLMNAVLSEKPDTPAAQKAAAFICMGCGEEEYPIRTIGYSTTVCTLMMLGMAVGQARGVFSPEDAEMLDRQLISAIRNIPDVIDRTLSWMDHSRRRIMRSRFIGFTGAGPLYGVAMEASVKMWEAPQYPSAGYELDEGMHGPNYGYNSNDAIIILNDRAKGAEKALALARYMKNEHDNGYIFG
ncbi:MAG: SIS domain-containing protein, partial [Clostridia bacterium]|nr:SIS domain-containing protein [Clostridia bacterium]